MGLKAVVVLVVLEGLAVVDLTEALSADDMAGSLWINGVSWGLCRNAPLPRDAIKMMTTSNRFYLILAAYKSWQDNEPELCTHMILHKKNDKSLHFKKYSHWRGEWAEDDRYFNMDLPANSKVKSTMVSTFDPDYPQYGWNYTLLFAKEGVCFVLRNLGNRAPGSPTPSKPFDCELWTATDYSHNHWEACSEVFQKNCVGGHRSPFKKDVCCSRIGPQRPKWC
ncbi:uncharacterized protein LOC135365852 isoform X1 [Ornithodoros turicata]|uniref:uncharacterized protein LOC135365852 isoform X1 n=1 Tax=Ornithodoros turicata TaxID=34597 RepID=UPI0031390A0E